MRKQSIPPTESRTQGLPQSQLPLINIESSDHLEQSILGTNQLDDDFNQNQNISEHEQDAYQNQSVPLLKYFSEWEFDLAPMEDDSRYDPIYPQNLIQQNILQQQSQNEVWRGHYAQNQPKQSKGIKQKKEEKTQYKEDKLIEMNDRSYSSLLVSQNEERQFDYLNIAKSQQAVQKQDKNKSNNNKIGNKKDKLLKRILEYKKYYESFNYERQLWDYFYRKIGSFDLDYIQTVQEYSDRKCELVEKLNNIRYKILKYEDLLRIVQVTMLIDKYVIQTLNINNKYSLKDAVWIIMITQDIRNAFNKQETSKALKQIYLILTDQDMTEEINWKQVIKDLHYQLEVSKNYYKSHNCGYFQYAKNFEDKGIDNPNFEKPWYEYGSHTQCKGGKKKFQSVNLRKLRDFTINYYLKYLLGNGYKNQNKKFDIYVDDLFNIIAQYKEF